MPATSRIYLYMGGKEGSAVPDVRRMHALLAERAGGPALTLSINPQGEHNETAWRAEHITVWNTTMDEYNYLVRHWSAFAASFDTGLARQ